MGSSDLDELGNRDESKGGVGRGLDPDQLRREVNWRGQVKSNGERARKRRLED